MNKYMFITDFETTGLNPLRHAPIQMAYQIVDTQMNTLIKRVIKIQPFQGAEVDAQALTFNGFKLNKTETSTDNLNYANGVYTHADESGMLKTEREAVMMLISDVKQYIDTLDRNSNLTPCAYNAPFDIGFLEAMLNRQHKRYQTYFNRNAVDPLAVLRMLKWFGAVPTQNLKLPTIYQAITGKVLTNAHDAGADVEACRVVLKSVKQDFRSVKQG